MNEYPVSTDRPYPPAPVPPPQPMAPVVSVGQWLRLYMWVFLGIIPIVGFLIVLIVYIVKLTSSETSPTIRNFLKAYGVYTLIGFGIGMVIGIVWIAAAAGMVMSLMQYF